MLELPPTLTTGIGGYGSRLLMRNCAYGPGRRVVRAELLLRRRRALDERLAALHLVRQWGFVDLDHDRVGIDAEVFHQRLGNVAHHAGLLLVGAAGGHAHGNLRHFYFSLCSCYVVVATNSVLILRSGLLAASRRMAYCPH